MPLIRIWAIEDTLTSGVAAPLDIFVVANHIAAAWAGERRPGPFEWRVESIDGNPVRTAPGQVLQVDGQINGRSAADAIWVAGPLIQDPARLLDDPILLAPLFHALRLQHARGALIASYCTGAFLLAEAGLLDGRVATTHWGQAASFRARYPEVQLRASDILTEDDRILCSGAVTSYQNLALRLVERLATPRLATATAKAMLIDLNRGSQDSFVDFSTVETGLHDDPIVERAQRWMQRHLREPFSLERVSRHLAVSERTLNRRFKQALGMPPLKYMQVLRIEVAKRLLEEKRLAIEPICERVGYADISGFRQLFKRVTGVSPGEYRRRFTR